MNLLKSLFFFLYKIEPLYIFSVKIRKCIRLELRKIIIRILRTSWLSLSLFHQSIFHAIPYVLLFSGYTVHVLSKLKLRDILMLILTHSLYDFSPLLLLVNHWRLSQYLRESNRRLANYDRPDYRFIRPSWYSWHRSRSLSTPLSPDRRSEDITIKAEIYRPLIIRESRRGKKGLPGAFDVCCTICVCVCIRHSYIAHHNNLTVITPFSSLGFITSAPLS